MLPLFISSSFLPFCPYMYFCWILILVFMILTPRHSFYPCHHPHLHFFSWLFSLSCIYLIVKNFPLHRLSHFISIFMPVCQSSFLHPYPYPFIILLLILAQFILILIFPFLHLLYPYLCSLTFIFSFSLFVSFPSQYP